MGFWELLILAIGLSADACAVSICKGLASKKADGISMLKCGIWFGGFQALMPLIGFFLGSLFAKAIEIFDHWIAFVLLILIGANMLLESFSKNDDRNYSKNADFSVKTMLTMAIATSIDALAIGVSLAFSGNVNIWVAILLIGTITFILSAIGVKIGNIFGNKFEKKAKFLGGLILIGLGIKILIEHLLSK